MDLSSDDCGFVYFNEVLFKTMKRCYGEEHVRNKTLVDKELAALRKIHDIKAKMIKQQRIKEWNEMGQNVNPFLVMMYHRISYRAWRQQLNKHRDHNIKEQEVGMFIPHSSDEGDS